ncbi:unnamed protein product [Tetraodon nigroviridis]|uniref:(spotted green pufferfish) hypothetical protein n=1 Tax=Tetraodon nigroviridis TaxID=99883 RepID=Q4SM20_TETNG|nr:unnamed protein product [Tetraodon nigroviridis]
MEGPASPSQPGPDDERPPEPRGRGPRPSCSLSDPRVSPHAAAWPPARSAADVVVMVWPQHQWLLCCLHTELDRDKGSLSLAVPGHDGSWTTVCLSPVHARKLAGAACSPQVLMNMKACWTIMSQEKQNSSLLWDGVTTAPSAFCDPRCKEGCKLREAVGRSLTHNSLICSRTLNQAAQTHTPCCEEPGILPVKETKEQSGISMQEIITITKSTVLDHALDRDFHTDQNNEVASFFKHGETKRKRDRVFAGHCCPGSCPTSRMAITADFLHPSPWLELSGCSPPAAGPQGPSLHTPANQLHLREELASGGCRIRFLTSAISHTFEVLCKC